MTDELRDDAAPAGASTSILRFAPSGPTAGPTPWFVSDRTAPRRRRSSDIVRLIVAAVAFGLLAWAASGDPDVDQRVFDGIGQMPGWIRSIAWFAYSASAAVALIIAVGTAFAGVGRGILRDLLAALAISAVLGLAVARLATGEWPVILPEFFSSDDYPTFPTLRIALVVAVALVLSPYVNVGVRRLLNRASVAVVLAPLFLGLTTITSLFGALMLGLVSVAAVRIAFGSPEGLPSVGRLDATLAAVGIDVENLRYLDEQPGTVGLATANTPADDPANGGRALAIKIYGEDAASRQRTERVWKALWYRRAGPAPSAGRAEQAQHEALALLSAAMTGVAVPEVVGAGMTPDGDVLLVTRRDDTVALRDVDELTDEQLASTWSALASLHRNARITNGGITPDTVHFVGDGAMLVDFDHASMFPTEQQLATDVVTMLVVHAAAVGVERAVAGATAALDPDDLEVCLPYLQDAVLEPAMRSHAKAAGVKVKDLRDELGDALGAEAVELAPVRRIKVQNVLIAIAAIIAANSLITQITDVGIETLREELAAASIGWLVVTFLIRLSSYTTSYFGMRALIEQDLPLLPTTLLQSAKSFVGLVVPSMVGRVGMDIRFLQNLGVPLAVASTQGPVISLVGFIAEVLLLLLCAWAIGQEVEGDELLAFDGGGLVAIAVAVVVIGALVIGLMPKLRAKIIPVIRDALASIKSIVTSPRKLGAIFASEVLERVMGGLALGATVAAFGADLSIAALIFVSVGTGLLAGLAPVPGGIGVAEATMTGLLTAVGLPSEQAVAIAIVYRMVTSYLPPVLGFFSFRWLGREGYL